MTNTVLGLQAADVHNSAPLVADSSENGAHYDSVVMDALHCGIVVTGSDGQVEYMNPAARALTGWLHASAAGIDVSEVLRIDIDTTPRRRIRDSLFCIEEDDTEPLASELIALDGSRHVVEIHGVVALTDGRLIYEIRDIGASVRRTERLIHEASHDSLTGLINRRELQRRLYELINGNNDDNHVLVFLDLDGFKRVNDECGHLAGDEVLQDIAGLLQGKMRRADSVARLGGDEFAVLLIGCLPDEGLTIAEELRRVIDDYEFAAAGRRYRVTASLGITRVSTQAMSIAQIMRRADAACYRAKYAGGNQVCVHDGRVLASQHTFARHSLEPRLREALAGEGLVVHSEEIRALAQSDTGRKCSIVPKIRAPSGRLMGPETLMPVAARSGMAQELDRWLIAHTLRVWHTRSTQEHGPVAECFVCLSQASLGNVRDTVRFIDEMLERFSIPSGTLCVEVKERDAIANWPITLQLVARLKNAGVRFCLSDFGAGLYTLGYLKRTAIDYIKLSVELLAKTTAEPFYPTYVRAIVDVAAALGIKVIGVGTDSDDGVERLRRLGVHYLQTDSRVQTAAAVDWAANGADRDGADPAREDRHTSAVDGVQNK